MMLNKHTELRDLQRTKINEAKDFIERQDRRRKKIKEKADAYRAKLNAQLDEEIRRQDEKNVEKQKAELAEKQRYANGAELCGVPRIICTSIFLQNFSCKTKSFKKVEDFFTFVLHFFLFFKYFQMQLFLLKFVPFLLQFGSILSIFSTSSIYEIKFCHIV